MNRICKTFFVKICLPVLYFVFKLFPKDEKLVVFADIRDRDMPDNFLEMHQMCTQQGYRCKVLLGRSLHKKTCLMGKILRYSIYYLSFLSLYARCRALFLVEYFPMTDFLPPRKGIEVVQLWHGCGAMKVMGYAASGKQWANHEEEWEKFPIHQNYTLVPVSSQGVVSCYEQAFHTKPGVVKALGVARTDCYFDDKMIERIKNRVLDMFPEINDRKIILFAPTFRGNDIESARYNLDIDIDELKRKLEDQYVLLTKYHPLMKSSTLSESDNGFVFDVTHLLSAEEALCTADILISDYSSIMFEYLLLRKPMISYIPDIDEYISDRGFFFPYEETMPGPYVKKQSELLDALLHIESWYNAEYNEKYLIRFMGACDGHSTERIFKEVFGK